MNGSTFVITDMPQDRANPANDLTEAAWQGIGAGTSLTAAKAAVNADTWAFFATDCGGALTAGEITRAGAGTNGNLNKLAKRLELGNPWPARLLLH